MGDVRGIRGLGFRAFKKENLNHLRAENFIGSRSATWLRDVAKVLNRRFEPDSRNRPLDLAGKKRVPSDEWKPLLLWHITRDEFLLRDFLENSLFAAYENGVFRIRTEEVEAYLGSIGKRGGQTETLGPRKPQSGSPLGS